MESNILLFSFFILSFIIIFSAGFILFASHVLHAAISLMIAFIGVAGLFVLFDAPFMAVTQIMIYIGGILVLILFGIMMARRVSEDAYSPPEKSSNISFIILITLLSVVLFLTINHSFDIKNFTSVNTANDKNMTNVSQIGILLMTEYLVPFEIAGFILLIALIGASYIAGKLK